MKFYIIFINVHAMSAPSTSPESYESASGEIESYDSGFLNSLNHSPVDRQHFQKDVLLEFNTEMAEVNLACTNYNITKLMLNTYNSLTDTNTQISHKVVKFVKDIISADKLQTCSKMKSRNGEYFDLLGLNDCFTERQCNLSPPEHSQLKMKVLSDFENKIEELKKKRSIIKEVFVAHGHQQMVGQEDIPQQKRLDKYLELFNSLTEKFNFSAHQLIEIADITDGLLYYQKYNHCQGQKMLDLSTITPKIKFLNYVTSILKEKVEQLLRKNKILISDLNTHGNELKQSVEPLRERLHYLEDSLDKYSRKEKQSVVFRELVKEYNKTKIELQRKHLTLSVLKDSLLY